MSLENPRVLLISVFFLSYCSHDLFFKKMVVWLSFGSKSGVFGKEDSLTLTFMLPCKEAALATLSVSMPTSSTPSLPDCAHLHTSAHLPCSLHLALSSLLLLWRSGLNLVSRMTPIITSLNHVIFSPLFPEKGRSYWELD